MQFPFPVVERSHATARHIRISVNATGEVLLTIPRRATKAQAREFLASRVEWVQVQLAKLRAQAPRAASRAPLWDGTDVLPWQGIELPLRWTRASVARPQVRIAATGIEVFAASNTRAELLTRTLKLALMREARLEAEDLLNREAHCLGLKWRTLRIGDTRAQWGSCARDGTVSLSWRLLLAPPEVFRYVVIHELCHLPHPDHSPRFWGLVAQQMPDYARHRQWLKQHGTGLHRWLPARTQVATPVQPDLFG
ncbi:MAG: SprT family zinc-dependent metalloprotease [Stagnimonas sp.]|nr:SprT family zinc-dependent metalloprotease [Stagnimonas sp.]